MEKIRKLRVIPSPPLIDARDAVIWTNDETKEVAVLIDQGPDDYDRSIWRRWDNSARVEFMLDTAADLTKRGFPLRKILVEFAKVRQFRQAIS